MVGLKRKGFHRIVFLGVVLRFRIVRNLAERTKRRSMTSSHLALLWPSMFIDVLQVIYIYTYITASSTSMHMTVHVQLNSKVSKEWEDQEIGPE